MLSKASCGTATVSLLRFKLLTETLIKEGLKLTSCASCVANKMVDDKQCTIVHHVHDTKISHVNPLVVVNVLSLLESNFGKMKIVRGKQHDFLSM